MKQSIVASFIGAPLITTAAISFIIMTLMATIAATNAASCNYCS